MRFDSQIRDNNALIENPQLSTRVSAKATDLDRTESLTIIRDSFDSREILKSKRESTKEKYPMEIITRRRYELLCVKINKMPNLFEWDVELDLVRGIK